MHPFYPAPSRTSVTIIVCFALRRSKCQLPLTCKPRRVTFKKRAECGVNMRSDRVDIFSRLSECEGWRTRSYRRTSGKI
ncbi:hypothetical protein DFH11DRAFT_1650659 [Phellopilus nigrolimitatus]|nr:hypothetical protein DFH11DRAFT_1650659 [Phellopilus nigrolimitatus]